MAKTKAKRLSKRAAIQWAVLAPALGALGLIRVVDAKALADYCEAIARRDADVATLKIKIDALAKEARVLLAKHGLVWERVLESGKRASPFMAAYEKLLQASKACKKR